MHQSYARRVATVKKDLLRFEGSRAVFFDDKNQSTPIGERFQQPDLAATLNAIGEGGTDAFYRGEFAKKVECLGCTKTGG